jgi:hypothetical protein
MHIAMAGPNIRDTVGEINGGSIASKPTALALASGRKILEFTRTHGTSDRWEPMRQFCHSEPS